MIVAVPTNIVWFRIYYASGSHALSTWYRNPPGWHLAVVRQFREKMEQEIDPARRASMESLLRAWRILYRLCLILLLTFFGAAAFLFVSTAIRAAA
jgi:hypothetical protein